jgi:hypothetical protein
MTDKPQTLADAIGVCLDLCQRCLAEVRALARMPGPPGPPGKNAADLDVFKDYIDQAVAKMFANASATSPDGGRTQRWVFGSTTVELKTAIVLDAGVWKEGAAYVKGDGVTSGGSFWIAQADTGERPGKSEEWRLAVKRGNDGRDAKIERAPEPVRFK